uniref:hypothetical protein n=1 Tax=Candidatus Electrothrix sp. TaxID=2170559 RepID=UPI0040571CEA
MTKRGHWQQVTFRLSGSLHVGSGRWGFVQPCRPYLPGWTLWGALTVLLKKQDRWSGGYGAIGQRLNAEYWLGHFFLTSKEGSETYSYLPALDQNQGGKTVFTWRNSLEGAADHLAPPTLFRHGTVRSRNQGQDSLGRLFLTETAQARQVEPYRLVGIIGYDDATDDLAELLKPGDTLRIGGNRQVGGAEITCEGVQPCPEEQRQQFLRRQHLRCNPTDNAAPDSSALSGELERIVLRRTRNPEKGGNNDFRGFGQHHVDWGCHLAPGWEGPEEQVYQPARDERYGFRHGTVEPV